MNNTARPNLTKRAADITASMSSGPAAASSAACGRAYPGFTGLEAVEAFNRRRMAEHAMPIDLSRLRISPFCFLVPSPYSVPNLFVNRFSVTISNPASVRQAFPTDYTRPDRRFCTAPHPLRHTNQGLTLENYDERRLPRFFRQARTCFTHRCNILWTGYLDNPQSNGVLHFHLGNKGIPAIGDGGSPS